MDGRPPLKCAGDAQGNRIAPPRFRPIAPKPIVNDPLSPSPQPSNCGKRLKRKYVRVRKNNTESKTRPRREKEGGEKTGNDDTALRNVATLQLLPEKEADQETPSVIRECGCHDDKACADDRTAEIDRMTDRTVGESLVAVECVEAAACTDRTGSSSSSPVCTDEEYWVRRLDADTCPGLISDVWNNVTWVNAAYGRMVGASPEIAGGCGCRVRLVLEDSVDRDELKSYGAVTCWVRISWRCTWRKKTRQMMVPCDAWRMDGGGFAWRLDLDAALSLASGGKEGE